MQQYVTIDKRSKKAQKEYYAKQRGTWGVINPVTRSVPSGKTYNRNKDKQERRRIGRSSVMDLMPIFVYKQKCRKTTNKTAEKIQMKMPKKHKCK